MYGTRIEIKINNAVKGFNEPRDIIKLVKNGIYRTLDGLNMNVYLTVSII